MKKVLAIGGSDTSSGAGLQADLKTFAAMRVYGLTVVTAVTAQNSNAVTGIHVVPPEFVAKQIHTILEDIPVDAVKTGMLANTKIIETVSDKLKSFKVSNIVVDPVMIATSGDLLMEERIDRILWAFRNVLLPLAKVVTPNIPEAEILTGREINTIQDMKSAAIDLQALGVPNIVIKGGHLDLAEEAVDLLFDGKEFIEFRSQRLKTKDSHGTGCTFASALAVGLALGLTVREAVGGAKEFVRNALVHSLTIGQGRGPVNHFGELFQKMDRLAVKE